VYSIATIPKFYNYAKDKKEEQTVDVVPDDVEQSD
jgi:hypothetical protein